MTRRSVPAARSRSRRRARWAALPRRSTIHLGHDLGMKVIGEGVEDEGTLARLASLGCDLIQGYYVSRPLAADAFTQWLIDRLGSPGDDEGEAGQPLQAST